ncbi:MAG: DddA-like double-stranded DNA deaminase toxin [Gemmatimonadales bacterium]
MPDQHPRRDGRHGLGRRPLRDDQGQVRHHRIVVDEDGIEHEFTSGDEKGADAERARTILREIGAASAPGGRYPAATHVEVKAAALMREVGVKTAVLVINYENGPCPSTVLGLSCEDVLPKILPAGYQLRVWYLDARGRCDSSTSRDRLATWRSEWPSTS